VVLDVFPERGLDQSLLVAVLVGVYVLLFFTERFGWVWAGLVVPGYLASVLAVQPAAGVAVVIEAVLTFLLGRAVSDGMSRLGGWSPFFGRERFFLIVLLSVIVRQACELWLIPDLLVIVDGAVHTHLARAHDVSSIGLVLVPLLANMFWKLPLRRGLFQVAVTVAITWAIVALVLLPYTNLSFSSFELTYEDVALDFLGSPKAYIILLTTAFVAAGANLAYGWDYNGILVPSLIALTWFRPAGLVATVVEAVILLGATRLVRRLPGLRSLNLEGPRKVTLVLTVGFLLKYAAGWAIGDHWPGLKLTDLFGFGYVLTSLLAVKMLDTGRIGRVLLPSIAVSILGFGAGSMIGFGLEVLAPRPTRRLPALAAGDATSERLLATPLGAMAAATVRARPELAEADRDGRPARELALYGALWRDVAAWIDRGAGDADAIARQAAELGIALRRLDDGGWVLAEAEERLDREVGWEIAVLYPGARGPVIEVPRPRREQPAAEAAVVLCERLGCRAIVASGEDGDDDSAADPLGHARATFRVAHRALRRSPVLQLRADASVPTGAPRLHLRHSIPDALRLSALWDREVELTWAAPPGANRTWRDGGELAVLRIHPDDLWRVLDDRAPALAAVRGTSVARWLAGWVDAAGTAPAPATPTELRVLEDLVVERMIAGDPAHAPWLGAIARTLGHELRWLPDGIAADGATPRDPAAAPLPEGGCWLLAGRDGPGWIAAAVAARPSSGLVIEVPRPRSERGTAGIGVEAWSAAHGAVLLVDAEDDGLGGAGFADPTAPGNVATAFQAVHQAAYRGVTGRAGAAVVAVRGFAAWRTANAELVASLGMPLLDPKRVAPELGALVAPDGALGRVAASRRWFDGGADVADLSGAGTPQLLYAIALAGPPYAIVWFAQSVRARTSPFGDPDEVRGRAARFGAGFVDAPVAAALADGLRGAAAPPVPADPRRDALIELAVAYAGDGDVATLAELVARAPRGAVRLGWSADLRLAYVLVELRRGRDVVRAAAVAAASPGAICAPIDLADGADAIAVAVQARCPRIVVHGVAP